MKNFLILEPPSGTSALFRGLLKAIRARNNASTPQGGTSRTRCEPKDHGFCIPLGTSLNMDGSALNQVLVVLFLGRVARIDFIIAQLLLIFMFVMMIAMLQMVGTPIELIGI